MPLPVQICRSHTPTLGCRQYGCNSIALYCLDKTACRVAIPDVRSSSALTNCCIAFFIPSVLQAEVMELKAPKDVSATGVVVEAQLSKGLGPIATVIVKRGVLKPGDPLVIGTEHGRVRALRDSNGKTLAEAAPGQAVVVSGLRGLPAAGDELLVVQDDARAARMASARSARAEDFRLNQLARMQAEARRQQQALREQEYERWVLQVSDTVSDTVCSGK